jgi:hypothetical protein
MDHWARRDPGILISFCGSESRITFGVLGREVRLDVGTALGEGLCAPGS